MIPTIGPRARRLIQVWTRALASGALLSPQTQQQRLDTTVPMNAAGSALYCLGIFNAVGWIGQTGSIFGNQTIAFYLPQPPITLVFLINIDVPHEVSTTLARDHQHHRPRPHLPLTRAGSSSVSKVLRKAQAQITARKERQIAARNLAAPVR